MKTGTIKLDAPARRSRPLNLAQRIVVALQGLGVDDNAVYATALQMPDEAAATEFRYRVLLLPAAQDALEFGLDNRDRVELHGVSVRCPDCGAMLASAPCAHCVPVPEVADRRDADEDDRVEGEYMPEPSDAQPGSPEKIEVLAMRWQYGAIMHHPDDAKLNKVKSNGRSAFACRIHEATEQRVCEYCGDPLKFSTGSRDNKRFCNGRCGNAARRCKSNT